MEFSSSPASDTWESNDVVLDEVFKYLSLPDLKSVRLTWKKWAIVGSRILARKSIIRLTEAVPHEHNGQVNQFKLPHWRDDLENDYGRLLKQSESIWEWEKDLEPRNYFFIDSYCQYTKLATFPSEFKPRHVAVYRIEDIEKLPIPCFTTIEKLQVVFYKPTKGYQLLEGLHKLFPNLTSLELRYIEPEEASSNSIFLGRGNNAQPAETRIRSYLQELSFAVPADLVNSDWSFMENFTDLKTLQVRWPGAFYAELRSDLHSKPRGMNHAYLDSNVFGNWLTSTKRYFNLDRLHEITLRFDFTTTNITAIQMFLNAANAGRIILEVHGDIESIPELIAGFHHKTVGALVLLYSACPDFSEQPALEIMRSLNDKGFFEKAAWALVFREYAWSGWIHLEKEKEKFVLQLKGTPYLDQLVNAIAKQFPFVLGNYNYAYCYETDENGHITNKIEALNYEAILSREFLNGFSWCEKFPGIRMRPTQLLCDLDEFRKDAALSIFAKHSNEGDSCTWLFSHVPESIIAKAVSSATLKHFESLDWFIDLVSLGASHLESEEDSETYLGFEAA